MTPGPVGEIHRIVNRVLTAPGRFTEDSVSEACSVTLRKRVRTNPYMHEFEAHPEAGPFSTITFRGAAGSSGRPSLVIMDVSAECRVTRSDLADSFRLSFERVHVNPRIPPEGVISFEEEHGCRTLHLQFTAESEILRSISVHEAP
ncbi:hypothetical protein [Nocardia donostiensis]|uniref:Uncharacterized protein n=1 Tax=Nocardia donostiensis TaxID=1538463 RepID=A0A1W0BE08_9NOCA|nr:hypothetical protein [Nocardia donostiensis]ONM50612.1 hypothetical protein B0T46_01555 [Nocardia donostiensis]OQS20744.1 hypothetical protein B0T44_08910 [Nocardia donostiensis]